VGVTVFELPVPDRKGKYRVRIEGSVDATQLPFRVQKPKRPRR
jgi:hypothetical protein